MPIFSNTDREWKEWGKQNPYFGVLTHPEFLNSNLTDEALQRFFASGQWHVDRVMATIRDRIAPAFIPKRVLDYGCGVGRLVIPFAAHAESVVGIDISDDMLKEAESNSKRLGVTSARFLSADQMESLAPRSFDLIHSFIVFQHIPVARGERILRKLIALLADNGVGVLHFTFQNRRPFLRRYVTALRGRVGFVNGALNLLQRKPLSTPSMQVNSYSMNRLFSILVDAHCPNIHIEFSKHGAQLGAMIYFQRNGAQLL